SGTGTGIFPMRDIVSSSPDVRDDLAAHASPARGAVGHQAVVGGQDRDAEAAEHAGDLVALHVDPESGLRDATQTRDDTLTVRAVLHGHVQRRLWRGVLDAVAGDVALL